MRWNILQIGVGVSLTVLACACVDIPQAPLPLSDKTPRVVSVSPSNETLISNHPEFSVRFSKKMDSASLKKSSLFLIEGTVDADLRKTSNLLKALDKAKLRSMLLRSTLSEDQQDLLISVDENLQPDTSYTFLITSRALSEEKIPLNQTPSGSEITEPSPFVTVYKTQEERGNESTPSSENFSESNETSEEAPKVSENESPDGDVPVTGTAILHEVYYDATGSDTDGVEFIEIYGTPGLSLKKYRINFIDGEEGKINDSITLPDNAVIRDDGFFLIADTETGSSSASKVPNADYIVNFDPQNGPDAIQLINSQGQLMDVVAYGAIKSSMAENNLSAVESKPAPDVASGHSLERRYLGFDTNDNSSDFTDRAAPTPGTFVELIQEPKPNNDPESMEPEPIPEIVEAPEEPSDELPEETPDAEPITAPLPSAPVTPSIVLNEIYYDAVGTDTNGVLFVEIYGTPEAAIGGYSIVFINGEDGVLTDSILLPSQAATDANGYYLIADLKTGSSTDTFVVTPHGPHFLANFDPQNGPDAVQLLDPANSLVDAVGYGSGVVPLAKNGLATFEGSSAPDVVNGHSLERTMPGLDTDNNLADFVERSTPTPGS